MMQDIRFYCNKLLQHQAILEMKGSTEDRYLRDSSRVVSGSLFVALLVIQRCYYRNICHKRHNMQETIMMAENKIWQDLKTNKNKYKVSLKCKGSFHFMQTSTIICM